MEVTAGKEGSVKSSTIEEKLRDFLNLHWLRPENALMRTFKSIAYEKVPHTAPSLDIACGDGTFMFVHFGGKFSEDFDYFKATRSEEFKHSFFVDIYNTCDDNYEIPIDRAPAKSIDFGCDWKQALLDKADALKLFSNLVLHDNNQVPLPFEDNHFNTVYSNSVYWVENPQALVGDIYRILRPGGTAALKVMTPGLWQTLSQIDDLLGTTAGKIIDRNRRATIPGSQNLNQWKSIFKNCGFNIVDIHSVYPNKVVVDLWNLGLRPISHLLVQMTRELAIARLKAIKTEWVEIFYTLLKPLLSSEPTYTVENSPYLLFIMEKP